MKIIKSDVSVLSVTAVISCMIAQPVLAAYSEPASYTNPPETINLGSVGYETIGWDDSAAFRNAIDDVAAAGGGVVWVPNGDYRLSAVSMKSNVHLKIHKNATLTLHSETSMFNFTGGIRNTSIRGIGGRFTVKIPDYNSARFVYATGVNNMMVTNVDIEDPFETIYSSFELTWDRVRNETPKNLTISNISCLNKEHYGYGIIQAQAASDSYFFNLEGHGGVPVRLETGWTLMNLAKEGGVFNIKATNITSEDGQAAVMMQPHTRSNGDVFLNFIDAVGSEFAVSLEKGGTWKYTAQQIADYNLGTGNFGKVSIGNAHAVYRGSGVPTRYAHLDFYPESELLKVFRDGNEIEGYSGPSIATFGNHGDANQLITWKITASPGFVNPPISTEDYNHPNSKKNRPSL
ncbi:glycosyl hydrolase family 28-related protein [Luteolibacter algae]|uniref:Glycosyl hydrolase family 28-related protein n=1 Tax=Luteolibacter algae TaxID=454151 RepID=A0ABW5D6L6_9BACT